LGSELLGSGLELSLFLFSHYLTDHSVVNIYRISNTENALPMTYGADILKTAINQNGVISILLSFSALLGFSVFLFASSIYNVNHKWIL